MKKKFLLLLVAVALLVGAQSLGRLTEAKSVSADLLLDNVEALAGGEGGATIICNGSGCVVCPLNGAKVGWVSERSIHR